MPGIVNLANYYQYLEKLWTQERTQSLLLYTFQLYSQHLPLYLQVRADLTSWKKSLCLQETEGTTENHNWSRCWDTNPNWYTYNSALHLRLRKNYGICHRKTCGGQKMRNSIFSTRPEAAPIQFQQHGLLSKIYKMITSVYLQTWVGKPH